ncbi:ras-related protein Rab-36 isoform X3 [Manis javanica]|uniref:ras-related protein Rab-36 isoform X3 n=1 Tax=Manis javanica TaxID=9974 RepID=UPI003C6DB6DA
MRSSLMPLGPPVSRDRIITSFPKWYTPNACLQLREHFHGQVSTVCQSRNTGTAGLKLSKVVVVGDLYVGKTSLIHRFCKNVFDRDYKATIGVDFEIERFEIAGIPYSLQIWDTAGQEKFKCIASAYYRGAQVIVTAFDLTDVQTLEHTRQWLEDALRENEPGSCFVFLVGTKKDLLGLHASRWKWRPCTWPMRCRLSTGRCPPRQRCPLCPLTTITAQSAPCEPSRLPCAVCRLLTTGASVHAGSWDPALCPEEQPPPPEAGGSLILTAALKTRAQRYRTAGTV